jgi:hypothetical protein
MRGKQDYRIFNSIREMPEELFDYPMLIVEKFIPEMQDGKYCLREWYFFGNVSITRAELSADPVSTYGDSRTASRTIRTAGAFRLEA